MLKIQLCITVINKKCKYIQIEICFLCIVLVKWIVLHNITIFTEFYQINIIPTPTKQQCIYFYP